MKPVCRPDAMQLPTSAFEVLLAQAGAVAGVSRGMIGRPGALNAEKGSVRLSGIEDADVDEEASHPDLRVEFITQPLDLQRHGFLEVAIEALARRRGDILKTILGEFQEGLKRDYSGLGAALDPDVLGDDGGEHLAAL